jgi:hypothetical protein
MGVLWYRFRCGAGAENGMSGGVRGRVWSGGALAALAVALSAWPVAAAEENPFLPPQERQAEVETRLQKRIDTAVAALEERLTRTVIDAIEGKAKDGPLVRAVQDALARRNGAPPAPSDDGAAPPLPPLPALAGGGGGPVPPGAVFVGCLDGKAFFQDRAGSSFLVDPRLFPPASGGAATCRG